MYNYINSLVTQPIPEGTGSIILDNPPGSHSLFYSNILRISSPNTINLAGNIIPDTSNIYSIGSNEFRFKDIFIGPGTLDIQGPPGSKQAGLIGSNLSGIVYTQFGFATPFINVGPAVEHQLLLVNLQFVIVYFLPIRR